MKLAVTLTHWAFHKTGDEYTAPECRVQILTGIVQGHPKIPDGEKVSTSAVLAINGRRVQTEHTLYLLTGEPEAEYAAWAKQNGIAIPGGK